MTCRCVRPDANTGDVRCNTCRGELDPAWCTTPETFAEFWQRLAEAIFPMSVLYGDDAPGPPAWFLQLELACQQRYEVGHEEFGYSEFNYLGRDNATEGQDEAADAANYAWFELLRQRQQGQEEEWATALTAAYHAAKLYEAMAYLRSHKSRAFSDTPQGMGEPPDVD